jgi:hypothetical protein
MDRNNDYLSPGQGVDGGKDEGWQTRNIDRKAIEKMYGPGHQYAPVSGDEARGGIKRPS